MFLRNIAFAILMITFTSNRVKANDTTYLAFVWAGDASKPYYEIFFYLPGSLDTSDISFFRRSYPVSPTQFNDLSALYINHPRLMDSLGKTLSYPSYYEAILVKGSKLTGAMKASTREELLHLYRNTMLLLSDYSRKQEVLQVWHGILVRMGIEAEAYGGKKSQRVGRRIKTG